MLLDGILIPLMDEKIFSMAPAQGQERRNVVIEVCGVDYWYGLRFLQFSANFAGR
jgi:hypothetical protein